MNKINNYIEHTILKPDATVQDIEKLAQDAIKYNFLGVCINPNYISLASELLKNSQTKIVTVVNFPLANNEIEMTQYQTEMSLKLGADEIDTDLKLKLEKKFEIIKYPSI